YKYEGFFSTSNYPNNIGEKNLTYGIEPFFAMPDRLYSDMRSYYQIAGIRDTVMMDGYEITQEAVGDIFLFDPIIKTI
ncbi:14877_t:CDS:2, partial [Dentiscutata erythropus]